MSMPTSAATLLQLLLDQLKTLVEGLIFSAGGWFTRRRCEVLYGTVTLGGSAAGNFTISLPSGSDCVVEKLVYTSTGIFDVQIQKTDENRYLSDARIPGNIAMQDLSAVVAADQGFHLGHSPMFCSRSCKLVFDCLDTSTAANTVRVGAFIRWIN